MALESLASKDYKTKTSIFKGIWYGLGCVLSYTVAWQRIVAGFTTLRKLCSQSWFVKNTYCVYHSSEVKYLSALLKYEKILDIVLRQASLSGTVV